MVLAKSRPLMPVYHGVLVLLMLLSAQALAADGVIRDMSGGVFVNLTPATPDMEVNSGDTLSTGPGGWAVVMMNDGSVLNLKNDTKVNLADYAYDQANPANNTIDAEVTTGTLRYVSGLIAIEDPGDVKIRAGNTTLGLRGTDFSITFSGGRVFIEVWSGTVDFLLMDGSVVSASQGQYIELATVDTLDVQSGAMTTEVPGEDQGGAITTELNLSDPGDRSTIVLAAAGTESETAVTLEVPESAEVDSEVFSQDPVTGEDLGGDPVGPTIDPSANL